MLLSYPGNSFLYETPLFLQHTKMLNLDDFTNEHNEEHKLKWTYIPDKPYQILIIGRSGSRKINAFLILIKQQDSDNLIDQIHLYATDFSKLKY